MPGDSPESEDEQFSPSEPNSSPWPRRQAYFVTVEWLDEPHRPASPEPLAQAIRHTLEHAHAVPAGTPPTRFIVRVKSDAVAAEVEGTVEHHHHHA